MKDYEKIQKYGDEVQEQQSIHYGFLRGYEETHIMWIFFDEQTEYEIKNDLPITTYKNLKMIEKPLKVDRGKLKLEYKNVLSLYNDCYDNKRIPLKLISDKYLKMLGFERPTIDDFDDLPF
jgi:hypothetical protein